MQFMHQSFGGKRFRAEFLGQKKGTVKVPFPVPSSGKN